MILEYTNVSGRTLEWLRSGLMLTGDFCFPDEYDHIIVVGAGSSLGKSLVCFFLSLKNSGLLNSSITAVCRRESQSFYRNFVNDMSVVNMYPEERQGRKIVFYCASPADPSAYLGNALLTFDLNSVKLAAICRTLGEKDRFVFFSTSGVYDRSGADFGYMPDESSPVSRLDLTNENAIYVNSKLVGEYITMLWARARKFKPLIIRLSITYTPFYRPDDPRLHNVVLGSLINGSELRMKSLGYDKRNFLCVFDFIRAICRICVIPSEHIFCNITHPCEVSVRQFVERLQEVAKRTNGFHIAWTDDRTASGTDFIRTGVTNKVLESLNWDPVWSLERGYESIVDLYLSE